ncbi:MAG: NADH-quinone oxidoreductase subunit NuoH [Nitriliruptoraceae bacterium]|nr:NADH-quinone oxidoreductase subunit NuoH [Nitriliruptoraceae bacterium]
MTVLTSTTALAQAPSILDVGDGVVLPILLKVALVLGLFFVVPLVGGYLEHKVMGRMQNRRGPVEAGPFGSLQLVADGIKFIQKEDIIPRAADKPMFALAPGLALVPALLVFLVIPLGPGVFAVDLELGLFYALAITSISVLGILLGGWASANKFSLIGGLRAGAQLIAYELPLIITAITVAVMAGTLSLVGIVEAQANFTLPGLEGFNLWFVFPQIVGFAIFFVAAMAELSRPPFDMPIGDSELVFGYMTEYTGIKFAMFLLTEYAGMITMSALMVVLFLGGWQILPGVATPGCEGAAGIMSCDPIGIAISVLVTLAKIMGLVFLMVWARVAYPRLREDQLQRISWLVLVPLSLANLAFVTILTVVL